MHKFQKEISSLGLMERLLSINRARFWVLGESRLIIVRINYRLKRTKNQALHAQISERNQHIGLDGEIVVNKPSEILGNRCPEGVPGVFCVQHAEVLQRVVLRKIQKIF